MKIIKHLTLIALTVVLAMPMHASSDPINRLEKETVQEMTDEERVHRVEVLEERLSDIQEMDIKSLERSQRKALKSELRYIQKELRAQANGGIYISSTAIIVIVILLILL